MFVEEYKFKFNLGREILLNQKLLLDLKIRLQQLLFFIKENDKSSKPYFCRFLKIMLHNIEIWENGNCKDTDELIKFIKEDWNYCNNVHTGIPEYGIWSNDYEIRKNLNITFRNMVFEIDEILNNI